MGEKSIMATMEECKGCGDELRLGEESGSITMTIFEHMTYLRARFFYVMEIIFKKRLDEEGKDTRSSSGFSLRKWIFLGK